MALRQIAVASITAYQRHLSPRKGFSCPRRRLHRGESCSAYVKRVVLEAGIRAGTRAARRRFQECRAARDVLWATEGTRDRSPKGERETSSWWWDGTDCADCTPECCGLFGEGLCSLLAGSGCG